MTVQHVTGDDPYCIKFLLIGDILYIGNFEDHMGLAKAATGTYMQEVQAAGTMNMYNPSMLSWRSVGFRVETPEDLRPEIRTHLLEALPRFLNKTS